MGMGRILVLAIAAAAAIFVGYYVSQRGAEPAAAPAPAQQTVVHVDAPRASVLVARRDLPVGHRVTLDDLHWQPWPEEAVSAQLISQQRDPDAMRGYVGAVARVEIAQGEPITGRRLVHPGQAGFMAAMLAPGMRAVATPLSAETGAGGFILPGDRVDVILTYELEREGGRGGRGRAVSRTVLENVRVLAIDQMPTSGESDRAYLGSTATLELNPRDAETIALAQAVGEITLSLRAVADGYPAAADAAAADRWSLGGGDAAPPVEAVRVYRYGQPALVALGEGR